MEAAVRLRPFRITIPTTKRRGATTRPSAKCEFLTIQGLRVWDYGKPEGGLCKEAASHRGLGNDFDMASTLALPA